MNTKKESKAKSKWPVKRIAIISPSQNLQMHIKELVKAFGWEVVISTTKIEQAVDLVRTGQASTIIVDDTSDEPAAGVLRILKSNIVTTATPILSFMLDSHETETKPINNLGPYVLIEKPLTPSNFNPAFKKLIAIWESNAFVALRMATYQHIHRGPEAGHSAMTKLLGVSAILPIVAHCMALHYLKNKKPADAEKILLYALKKQPKHLGLLLALGEFYMHTSMPHLAHRLFSVAQQTYGNSLLILSDLSQSALFLNKYPEAEEALQIIKTQYLQEQNISEFIARIQFADGRQEATEKMYRTKKIKYKKLNEHWLQAAKFEPAIDTAS